MADFYSETFSIIFVNDKDIKVIDRRIKELHLYFLKPEFDIYEVDTSEIASYIKEEWDGYSDSLASALNCIKTDGRNNLIIKNGDFNPEETTLILNALYRGIDTTGITIVYSTGSSPMVINAQSGGIIFGTGNGFRHLPLESLYRMAKDNGLLHGASEEEKEISPQDKKFNELNYTAAAKLFLSRIFPANEAKAREVLAAMRAYTRNCTPEYPQDIEKCLNEFRENYKKHPIAFDAILEETRIVYGNICFDISEVNVYAYVTILSCFVATGSTEAKEINFVLDKDGEDAVFNICKDLQ